MKCLQRTPLLYALMFARDVKLIFTITPRTVHIWGNGSNVAYNRSSFLNSTNFFFFLNYKTVYCVY